MKSRNKDNICAMLEQPEVTEFFDESAYNRRLVPNVKELSGWGTYRKYQEAVNLMGKPGMHKALDLGCSIGSIEYLYSLKRRPCQDDSRLLVAGLDLSINSVKRAKELGLPFAHFIVGDGCFLPFAKETFDLVVCIEVIEHVADKTMFLQEIYRVLRTGGKLYLTTPNMRCISSLLEEELKHMLRILFRRSFPAKDEFLNRERLTRLLAKVGFDGLDTVDIHLLPRPFMTLWGWSLTPPLPPTWALVYQKFWNKVLGYKGRRLLWLRDRVYHTLSFQLVK